MTGAMESSASPSGAPLLRIAIAIAAQNPSELERAFARVADGGDQVGAVNEAVEELILQSILFLGYPIGLEAMAAWRASHGQAAPPPTAEEPRLWAERGIRLFRTVYGDQAEPVRAAIRALHPDAEQWMLTEGYGRVLGRPGLDLVTRELAIVAQLAVLGTTRQLHSHLRGALRVGASVAAITWTLEAAKAAVDEAAHPAIDEVWARVQERTAEPAVANSSEDSTSRPEPVPGA